MKQEVKQGQTDYTVLILVRDTSGNAKTGLAFGDIDLAYSRVETDNDVTTTDVAPADLVSPALTDPHLDWGFLEVSAGDHPGLYRLDLADAVFASGAWSSVVTLTGAGLEPSHIEFMLIPESPYSNDGSTLTEAGGDGDHLVESGGTGDQLTAIANETDKIGVIPALDGGDQTIGAAIAKIADDDGGATFDAGEDSLNKIRDDRTLAAADYTVVGDLGTVQGADNNTILSSLNIANGAVEADLTYIHGSALTESVAGYLAAAFVKLFDVVTPLLVSSDAMRGTESAALATVCTEGRLAELDAANLPTDIAAVPTAAENKTAMEADGGDLSSLMEALVNKLLITEASGNAEVFNDAGVSQGTVAAAFTSVAGVTQRKRMVI